MAEEKHSDSPSAISRSMSAEQRAITGRFVEDWAPTTTVSNSVSHGALRTERTSSLGAIGDSNNDRNQLSSLSSNSSSGEASSLGRTPRIRGENAAAAVSTAASRRGRRHGIRVYLPDEGGREEIGTISDLGNSMSDDGWDDLEDRLDPMYLMERRASSCFRSPTEEHATTGPVATPGETTGNFSLLRMLGLLRKKRQNHQTWKGASPQDPGTASTRAAIPLNSLTRKTDATRNSENRDGQCQTKSRPWDTIHPELWEAIMCYLPIQNIMQVFLVNKRLYFIGLRPGLWRMLLFRDFSTDMKIVSMRSPFYTTNMLRRIEEDSSGHPKELDSMGNNDVDMARNTLPLPKSVDLSATSNSHSHYRQTYRRNYLRCKQSTDTIQGLWERAKQQERWAICCGVSRCFADAHQFVLFPSSFALLGLVTMILLAVKLGNDDAFSWLVVLLPLQLTVGFAVTSLLQAAILMTRPRCCCSEEIGEHVDIEECAVCGQIADHFDVDYSDCDCSFSRMIFHGVYLLSIASLITFVVLLTLKLVGSGSLSWSLIFAPLEFSLLFTPGTVLVAFAERESSDLKEALAFSSVFVASLCLPIVITLILLGLNLDGYATLAMWEIMMPILIALGLLWIALSILFGVVIWDEIGDAFEVAQGVCAIIGVSCLVLVIAGVLGAQAIVFIVWSDTDLLDNANYFEIFSPSIALSILFCIAISTINVIVLVDRYDSNTYFSDGCCGYLSPSSRLGKRLKNARELLDTIATG